MFNHYVFVIITFISNTSYIVSNNGFFDAKNSNNFIEDIQFIAFKTLEYALSNLFTVLR